jgi:hypothetical protein
MAALLNWEWAGTYADGCEVAGCRDDDGARMRAWTQERSWLVGWMDHSDVYVDGKGGVGWMDINGRVLRGVGWLAGRIVHGRVWGGVGWLTSSRT